MLADRKFYCPISSKPAEEPPAAARRRCGPVRHWTPIAPNEFVTVDGERPYTGDHSPMVKLDKLNRMPAVRAGPIMT